MNLFSFCPVFRVPAVWWKAGVVLIILLAISWGEGWGQDTAPSDIVKKDMALITERVIEDIRGGSGRRGRNSRQQDGIKQMLDQMKEDGSFEGIDYQDKRRTMWPANRHLTSLLAMAMAYTEPGGSYYRNKKLKSRIESGLEYWHARNPVCNNWWYNQISAPQLMGRILLVMNTSRDKLPQPLQDKLLERMKAQGGDPSKQTGANKMDVALHYFYRACLTRDDKLMKYSLDQLFMPLAFVTGEGIQHDYSYTQHGRQLYIGGYGNVVAQVTARIGTIVEGTQYALSPQQRDIYGGLLRNAFLKVIRGQNYSFNVLGRGITRPNALSQRGFAGTLKKAAQLDREHAAEYQDAIQRLEGTKPAGFGLKPSNTGFYRTDYMLHQRPAYTVDVRTVSLRTIRNEQGTGNGEGYKQYFLSDGGMNIAVTGEEYYNIFPVWNWSRIPGVTGPVMEEIPLAKGDWAVKGTVAFTGGVSTGTHGAYAYDYRDDYLDINSRARKAWFFFDEEVVCLGNGVTSTSPYDMATTVNQCFLKGKAVVTSGRRDMTLDRGKRDYDNTLTWVHHGGIGYYFPQGGKIGISCMEQEGTWYSINRNHSQDIVKGDVFTLWVDHGRTPVDQSYAYMILPGKKNLAEAKKHPVGKVRILSNDDSFQAVYHEGLKMLQLIFWKAGTFVHGPLSLEADHACALIVRNPDSHKPEVFAADLTHTLESLSLIFKAPGLETEQKLVFDLQGPAHEKGKTHHKTAGTKETR